jgi:Kelch motif
MSADESSTPDLDQPEPLMEQHKALPDTRNVPALEPAEAMSADPPAPRRRRRPRRPPESGLRPILLIDALALLLVIATAPAAWLWIDSSSPGALIRAAELSSAVSQGPILTSAGPSGAGASSGPSLPAAAPSDASQPGSSPKLIAGDGAWARAESLSRGLWGTGGALLRDGRYMVVGGATGSSSNFATAAVSIYDPTTGHWSAATQMLQPRAYPMVVRLADGSILVAGGSRDGQPLDTAERYNPSNGTWVAAGRLNLPRTQGNLVLLPDGRALATGGGIEGSPGWTSTASVELFDPTKGAWTIGTPMSVARAQHTATVLPSGDVLVTGGATAFHGDKGSVTAGAEIYTPRTNSWRAAAAMSIPRYVHQAALLADGRVLVAGGWSAMTNSDVSKASTEIYDPATNRWVAGSPLVTARAEFVMVRLLDGRLLAMAGVDRFYLPLDSAELFDPAVGSWRATGKLAEATMWPSVVVLADGRVLLAGGATDVGAYHLSVACVIYSAP